MESKYGTLSKQSMKINGTDTSNYTSLSDFFVKRKMNESPIGIENRFKKKAKYIQNKKQNVSALSSVKITNELPKPAAPTARGLIEIQRQMLPVFLCKDRIIKEVRRSDTLLIMGETGTGKTTQIPQFLLSAGFGQKGKIGITQPRRVAAITVAKRVAQEYGCKLGEVVGYTVRFEDLTSEETRIRFVTDGFLLREALSDRLLLKYSVLMLDEAHERTINNDVLFGIVKDAQRSRKLQNLTPLKLIITSATMDIDHFSKYFAVDGMYLEGKNYPVIVYHAKTSQSDYLNAVLVTLFEIHQNAPANHDVLVFLTGQQEIECMAQQIRLLAKTNHVGLPNLRVFPLYAQLQQSKQLECFLPAAPNSRKIILATNIAETSITIPGIRFVIDCGFVKQRIFNPESSLDVLKVVRISQAQCWQRCGRAGRDAEGICYRTYTKTEMERFCCMPKPEILRSNLSATILQLLTMEIDCKTFDFLDRPPPEAMDNAYKKLKALGAIKNVASPELTTLGRQMSAFPLDPKYSKLLLTASSFGCMDEMLSLVAMLSGENIFISSTDKREAAALAHAKFESKHGDHLTLLNVYIAFQKTEKVKLWCHDNFINTRNLLYSRDVRKQLLEISEQLGLQINSCGTDLDQVRKCLLAGLFDNIAVLQPDNFYMTISDRQRAKIHPSSVFHGKYYPEYIIFSECVHTERNFLRLITEIDATWISEVVPNYCHLNRIKIH